MRIEKPASAGIATTLVAAGSLAAHAEPLIIAHTLWVGYDLEVTGMDEGAHLDFAITDTSIGMSPEQVQEFRHADSSTPRKYGGTFRSRRRPGDSERSVETTGVGAVAELRPYLPISIGFHQDR